MYYLFVKAIGPRNWLFYKSFTTYFIHEAAQPVNIIYVLMNKHVYVEIAPYIYWDVLHADRMTGKLISVTQSLASHLINSSYTNRP